VFGDFNSGVTVDQHDLQRAEPTDQATPAGGPPGDGLPPAWEGYSPDTLAALFDSEGWHHADW
jgi:hypothetical protein